MERECRVINPDVEAAQPIMDAIVQLIELHLMQKPISKKAYEKLNDQIEAYYADFEKKNPDAEQFDSQLSMWMIHDREFLRGTPYATGGPPYYFFDQIEEEFNY